MLGIFGSDQLSKAWIINHPELPLGSYWPNGGFEVIPEFFYIVHIGNPGAAWGLFGGYGVWLALLALLALAAIYYFRHELMLQRLSMQIAFGLLCGGILGNLFDRVLHGHVVDFLDFHLPGYRWPAFNFADSSICIGIFAYLLISFSDIRDKDRAKEVPDLE